MEQQKSQTKFNEWRLLEHLFDAVALFDSKLKLLYGNARFRKLSGIPDDFVETGGLIAEILNFQTKLWTEVLDDTFPADKVPQIQSAPFSFQNGTKGFAQIVIDQLPKENDEQEKIYLCVIRDITFEIESRSILTENEKLIAELKRNHAEAYFLWRLALETPIYLEPPEVLTAIAKKLKEELGFTDATFLRVKNSEGKEVFEPLIQDQRIGSRLREVAKVIGQIPATNLSRMDVSSIDVPPYGHFWIGRFRPKLERPFILLARTEPSEAESNRRGFLEPLALQIIEWLDNRSIYISSITDSLTGLFNRRHFDSRLAIEFILARERNIVVSVLMLDIDNFKEVNDKYGHQAGDEVLKVLGGILKNAVRSTDLPARLGGEEFGIMLVDTSPDDAVKVAEKIRERLESTLIKIPLTGQELKATISIGVSGYQDKNDTPESVMKAADDALYQAKKSGRNRVVLSPLR